MPDVRIGRAAERDLRRIGPGPARDRIRAALVALGAGAPNLDVRPLVSAKGWHRLRIGDYRAIYWRRPDGALLVERIVHRSKLDEIAASLPGAGT